MKKMIALLCVFTLSLGVLAGCDRSKPESEPESTGSSDGGEPSSSESQKPASDYKDGEYSAAYTAMAIDRTLDYLTVSVADGEMTIKEYSCKEDTSGGGEVTGDGSAPEVSQTASQSGDTDAEKLAKEQMELIRQEYEELEGDLDALQNAADADEHTYRFVRMMRMVQQAAKKGDTAPIELGRYADGSYKATMPAANSDGWIEYVKMTVTNGEIGEVEFNAGKSDDPNVLITNDPTANSGTDKPSEYYPQIAKNFTEAGGDLSKMFAPTGGGKATKTFNKLMQPLLASAFSGGETEITAPKYVSGTYKAQFADFDEYGWKDYVVLSISNDVVTIDEFDAVSKEDEKLKKSEAKDSSDSMKAKTGITPADAANELASRWESAGNDVIAVENVAGATVSSNNFKLLVGQILATAALEGDNQATLEVERLDASGAASSGEDAAS